MLEETSMTKKGEKREKTGKKGKKLAHGKYINESFGGIVSNSATLWSGTLKTLQTHNMPL